MPKPDQPKVSVVLYTILDNYHRHVEELRAVGAQPADLQPLKAAAAAVEAAELEADRLGIDVGAATAPFLSCTGWTIAPPTVAARYWAGLALIKITGGKVPDAVLGEFLALFAGLLILRLWGEGQKDKVMRLVTRPGELAELLATSTEAPKDLDLDKLADEWLVLMGLKKKRRRPGTTRCWRRSGRGSLRQRSERQRSRRTLGARRLVARLRRGLRGAPPQPELAGLLGRRPGRRDRRQPGRCAAYPGARNRRHVWSKTRSRETRGCRPEAVLGMLLGNP